jgi:hypothetical protein
MLCLRAWAPQYGRRLIPVPSCRDPHRPACRSAWREIGHGTGSRWRKRGVEDALEPRGSGLGSGAHVQPLKMSRTGNSVFAASLHHREAVGEHRRTVAGAVTQVKPAGVVCDGYRVIFGSVRR